MVVLLVLWLSFGAVTGIVASSKGYSGFGWFLLGCILGVFGLILIALLPSRIPVQVQVHSSTSSQVQNGYIRHSAKRENDYSKWQILKEVDPDIRAAAARAMALGPQFEKELADKYLTLNDKEYLAAIENKVTEQYEAQKRRSDELTAASDAASAASSLREMERYKALVQESNGKDPYENVEVLTIEPYNGGWLLAKGGIKVTLRNGWVVLRKGDVSRRFNSESEVY